MAIIRWAGFAGENRNLHPKLLPASVGVTSLNQKPGKGDFRPWRSPTTVTSAPTGTKTIYRMGRDVADESNYWLTWPTIVHAVRDFNEEDTTERTFYTGDGAPKVTDNTIALASTPYPTANRPLGLPVPAAAPTAAKDVGTWTGDVVTHFYVYTYVNDWGWESAPSPVSTQIDRESDATVSLSGFSTPPAGNYQINKIRVYRTQTGSSGATEFFFLREIAIGTSTTTDDNRTLGEVLETTTWLPPPADLSFLTPMWNGMLAGISGNAVRFCEAYVGYAWPVAYDVLPPDSKPVALGTFGQNLLVLTTGNPLLVVGTGPDALDQVPVEFAQACLAPESVVSMGNGVAWASSDGLCWYGTNGPEIITAKAIGRDEWQAMRPETIIGRNYEGLYVGSYEPVSGQPRKMFMIAPGSPDGVFFLDKGYEAMHFDKLLDQLFVLDGTDIQKWDSGTTMTASATSKEFLHTQPVTFAMAQVVADTYPVTVRITAKGLSADTVTTLLTKGVPGVDSPAAGEVRYTKSVANRKNFKLPTGFKAYDWQLSMSTQYPVQGVAVASTIEEIKQS